MPAKATTYTMARADIEVRRHLLDIGIAVVFCVPALIAAAWSDTWPALTSAAIIAAGAALCWRRRAPMTVLVAVCVLASITVAAYLVLPLCLAVLEVAWQKKLGHAIVGYLLAVGLPLVGTTAKILLGLLPPATHGVAPPVELGTSIVNPYLVAALAVGIVGQNIRQRRRAQEELWEQRVEHARALERTRITAEMHDVVGHALTVMISLANGARSARQTDPERSDRALEHLASVGAGAIEDMQRTLRVLRDSDAELDQALERGGHDLSTVEDMIEVFRAAGLPVTLTRVGSPIPQDTLLNTAIHRIIQEGLTNALRYAAGATLVEVTICCRGDTVTLTVVDNGQPRSGPSVGTGRGLIGVGERAASFGGTSDYGPIEPHGWATRATLRMEQPE